MLAPTSNVAILGFGARAASFAALLAPRGCALRAWDPALAEANTDAHDMRTRIEAAGVDCMVELSPALRGARLVVLDTVPLTAWLAAQLQDGQQLLDLATAEAAQVDAVLVALGVPPGATMSRTMANSAAATPGTPPVRRGELP